MQQPLAGAIWLRFANLKQRTKHTPRSSCSFGPGQVRASFNAPSPSPAASEPVSIARSRECFIIMMKTATHHAAGGLIAGAGIGAGARGAVKYKIRSPCNNLTMKHVCFVVFLRPSRPSAPACPHSRERPVSAKRLWCLLDFPPAAWSDTEDSDTHTRTTPLHFVPTTVTAAAAAGCAR